LSGEIHTDGSAALLLQSGLFPGVNSLLKSLGPKNSAEPVLSAALLNEALSASPGVASAALHNTTSGDVEGRVAIASMAEFFNGVPAPPPSKDAGTRRQPAPPAVWEQTAGGGGRLTVNLNRDTGMEFISRISPLLADYLSALMAPVITGEVIDKAGYLELTASVYGKVVADEINRARLSITLDFPGPIEKVTGGKYRGSSAEFEIRLIDALVLEKPVFYEVRWTAWR
jgi:hypothetical protein